jgi:hypothetical protein
MRKLLLPVAAVLAWSVALAALSEFEAVDGDRDGAVLAGEPADAAGSMFMTPDADADGKVDAAEKIEVADQSGRLRQAELYAGHATLQKD